MIGEYERLPGSHLRMNRRVNPRLLRFGNGAGKSVSLLNQESPHDSRFTSILRFSRVLASLVVVRTAAVNAGSLKLSQKA